MLVFVTLKSMNKLIFIILLFTIITSFAFAQDSLTRQEIKMAQKSFLLEDRKWNIGIPLWIPGFRGDFAYGDIDIEGEDGGDPGDPGDPDDDDKGDIIKKVFSRLFDAEWYLKFFYLSRFRYQNKRFLAQLDGFGGGVGSSVKFNYNNKEIVRVAAQNVNVRLYVAYLLYQHTSRKGNFRYKLYGYLGARAHFVKVYSELDGILNVLDISPNWVEPVIGIQNQFIFKRWLLSLQADYGGYLNHNKQSNMIQAFVSYRTGRITSLKLGWNYMDLNHRGEFLGEEVKVDVRLAGPSFGVAFHF